MFCFERLVATHALGNRRCKMEAREGRREMGRGASAIPNARGSVNKVAVL